MPLFARKHRAKPVEPRFAVADLGGGEAEITLYGDVIDEAPRDWATGEVVEGSYISADLFNQRVEEIKDASHVTVRLNSCGGDLYTGLAIHNTLKAMPAKVTVRIDGIAASAASVIASAGDEVVAMPGSMFMIHAGYLGLFGFYSPDELTKMANSISAGVDAMVNVYVAKTGQSEEQIREWVDAETWFVGREIVDAGFADVLDSSTPTEVEEPEDEPDEEPEGELMVAGVLHDVSRYHNVPTRAARIAAMAASTPTPAEVDNKETPDAAAPESIQTEPQTAAQERGETSAMDVTELRAAHPDLVNEVAADAAKAERERIAAIDRIAKGIPAEMVEDAKYEHPMSAEQLAFKALAAQQEADANLAKRYAEDVKKDNEDSGAEDVTADPTADPEDPEKKDEEEQAKAQIAATAKLFASMNGGRR